MKATTTRPVRKFRVFAIRTLGFVHWITRNGAFRACLCSATEQPRIIIKYSWFVSNTSGYESFQMKLHEFYPGFPLCLIMYGNWTVEIQFCDILCNYCCESLTFNWWLWEECVDSQISFLEIQNATTRESNAHFPTKGEPFIYTVKQ